jgi:hypothetical protein
MTKSDQRTWPDRARCVQATRRGGSN